MYKLSLPFTPLLLLLLLLQVEVHAAEKPLRDPTQPPLVKSGELVNQPNNEINISAIFDNKKNSHVMIGQQLLTVGDQIFGLKIIIIDSYSITLQAANGSRLRVAMSDATIKSLTTNNKKSDRENLHQ